LRAEIVSPVAGSTLAGSAASFAWVPGRSTTLYSLRLGSTAGAWDVYLGGDVTAFSAYVTGLPMDGRPLFARLWCVSDGSWQYNDYVYTTVNGKAQMASPLTGSTLAGSSASFSWSGALGATSYSLRVGSTPGAWDVYLGGDSAATSATIGGLPTDGRTL